jgi:hypothetical protein
LVVVAITQMKQLRAEAGHGSEATVIDLGLVGPKLRGNFSQIGLMYQKKQKKKVIRSNERE